MWKNKKKAWEELKLLPAISFGIDQSIKISSLHIKMTKQ